MAIPTNLPPDYFTKNHTQEALRDDRFYLPKGHIHGFNDFDRQAWWMPTDAEKWTLESYVIQNFDYEQGEFNLEFIYPHRMPDMSFIPVDGPKRGEDKNNFMVVGAYANGDSIVEIEMEVGMWDGRYRLRKLRHGDSEEIDPADVLDTGEEKWVNVHQYKTRKGEVKTRRGMRTDYRAAGGPSLDPRRDRNPWDPLSSPNDTYDIRREWREIHTARMDSIQAFRSVDPNIRIRYQEPHHDIHFERQYVDRAHADEMQGPACSDKPTDSIRHTGGTVAWRTSSKMPNWT